MWFVRFLENDNVALPHPRGNKTTPCYHPSCLSDHAMSMWPAKHMDSTNSGGLYMARIGQTGLRLSNSLTRPIPYRAAPEGKSVRGEKVGKKKWRVKHAVILNDVPTERRLAYLLDFTLERHVCKAGFWTPRGIVVIGTAIVLLLVLWRLLT
jgi:hypothetical protein